MAEILLNDINEKMLHNPVESIEKAELAYLTEISDAAKTIINEKRHVVLIAGPSGSGKTTTANILSDILIAENHPTAIVSLDNFYREKSDPLYPKDENGELDYECVDALNVGMIHDCIEALLRGEVFNIPRYVFGSGISHKGSPIALPENGFIIIEGIHALNPSLTKGIDPKKMMKIFISVSTNIEHMGERLLSGRKVRFIRRLTRDSIYRGTDAKQTLERWQRVLNGEDIYLYPYKSLADIKLDTFHEFELSVMKPFAMKAIESAGDTLQGEYIEKIKYALDKIQEIPLSFVPITSLIREFIPGGKYEEIYQSSSK